MKNLINTKEFQEKFKEFLKEMLVKYKKDKFSITKEEKVQLVDYFYNISDFMKESNNIDSQLLTEGSDNYKTVIVFGETKKGKSTVINYLLGNKLQTKMGGISGKKIIGIEVADKNCSGPEIGLGPVSKTEGVKPWPDEKNEIKYIDCAGLHDNKGFLQQLKNSFSINKLFKTEQNSVILFVTDFNIVRNTQDLVHFEQFAEMVKKELGTIEQIQKKKDSIILLITKRDTVEKDYPFKDDFHEIYNAINETDDNYENRDFRLKFAELLKNENGIRVCELPFPRKSGEINNKHQDLILKQIKSSEASIKIASNNEMLVDSQYLLALEEISKIIKEYIKDIIDDLALEAKQSCISYYNKAESSEILKNSLQIFASKLKNLQKNSIEDSTNLDSILTSILQVENSKEVEFIVKGKFSDIVKKVFTILKTLEMINPNITPNTDAAPFKALTDLGNSYTIFAGQIDFYGSFGKGELNIKAPLIGLSEIEKWLNEDNKFVQNKNKDLVSSISTSSFLFIYNSDVKLPSVNISFAALKWNLINSRIIDCSGNNGQDGIEDNKNGTDGNHGGNVLGYAKVVQKIGENSSLTILSNGGNGGNGAVASISPKLIQKKLKNLKEKIGECKKDLKTYEELEKMINKIPSVKKILQTKLIKIIQEASPQSNNNSRQELSEKFLAGNEVFENLFLNQKQKEEIVEIKATWKPYKNLSNLEDMRSGKKLPLYNKNYILNDDIYIIKDKEWTFSKYKNFMNFEKNYYEERLKSAKNYKKDILDYSNREDHFKEFSKAKEELKLAQESFNNSRNEYDTLSTEFKNHSEIPANFFNACKKLIEVRNKFASKIDFDGKYSKNKAKEIILLNSKVLFSTNELPVNNYKRDVENLKGELEKVNSIIVDTILTNNELGIYIDSLKRLLSNNLNLNIQNSESKEVIEESIKNSLSELKKLDPTLHKIATASYAKDFNDDLFIKFHKLTTEQEKLQKEIVEIKKFKEQLEQKKNDRQNYVDIIEQSSKELQECKTQYDKENKKCQQEFKTLEKNQQLKEKAQEMRKVHELLISNETNVFEKHKILDECGTKILLQKAHLTEAVLEQWSDRTGSQKVFHFLKSLTTFNGKFIEQYEVNLSQAGEGGVKGNGGTIILSLKNFKDKITIDNKDGESGKHGECGSLNMYGTYINEYFAPALRNIKPIKRSDDKEHKDQIGSILENEYPTIVGNVIFHSSPIVIGIVEQIALRAPLVALQGGLAVASGIALPIILLAQFGLSAISSKVSGNWKYGPYLVEDEGPTFIERGNNNFPPKPIDEKSVIGNYKIYLGDIKDILLNIISDNDRLLLEDELGLNAFISGQTSDNSFGDFSINFN